MKEQITVTGQEVDSTFTISGPHARLVEACKDCRDAIAKSNIDYEITINANGLVSFVPFVGLGNAWGSKFGFTFGCGPYSPSEGVLQNGLFAVANFVANIEYHPYENAAGYEGAVDAAKIFSDKVAKGIRDIALDVGRPVFPMSWTLTEERTDFFDTTDKQLTITLTPRISQSIYGSKDDTEYQLTPREVLNAIVFYAATVGKYNVKIGNDNRHLHALMGYAGVPMPDESDLAYYQANAFGVFSDRWSAIDTLDTESEGVLKNPDVITLIDDLLSKRSTVGLAAVEIIALMDHYCRVTK